jgi:hypothetical protein
VWVNLFVRLHDVIQEIGVSLRLVHATILQRESDILFGIWVTGVDARQ